MSFRINKKTPIVLYGVSPYRTNIFFKMKNCGYNVIAYFDVRADELNGTLDGPVYTIENAPFTEREKKEISVFICLQNAIQHDRVAKILVKHGYEKILFLPTDSNIKPEYAKILRGQFNYFYRDQYDKIGGIPHYKDIFYKEIDCDRCIIEKSGETYTVWLPLDLVYTDSEAISEYSDVNISAYSPYINLFDFFSGRNSHCEEYLAYIKPYNFTNVNDTIISNRTKLYYLFMEELNNGMAFFIQSAPPASWNKRGYFNLKDGHHRTIFLFTKDLTLYPCRITKYDFDKWVNKKKLKELISFVFDNDITQLPGPIAHPAFTFFKEKSCGSIYITFKHICKYLLTSKIKGKSALETGEYNGFFARFYARTTTKPVFILQNNKVLNELARLTNELLYLNDVHMIENEAFSISNIGKIDIIFMMRFISKLMIKESIEFLKKVNECVLELIVWESGEEPEEEKRLILTHSCFKQYILLSRHFNGEYISEIGIFKK